MKRQALPSLLYGLSTLALGLYVLGWLIFVVVAAPPMLGVEAWQAPAVGVHVDLGVMDPNWRVDPLQQDAGTVTFGDLRGEMTVHAASPELLARLLAPSLLTMAFGFIVLITLRNMLRDVRDGAPFTDANVGRLRILAVAVALSEVFQFVLPWMLHDLIRDYVVAPGLMVGVSGTMTATPFLFALVLLVLAEVFRHGLRLEDDQSLTV